MENLYKTKKYVFPQKMTQGRILKQGQICNLLIDSGDVFNGKRSGEILLNIPEDFRPKELLPISTNNGTVHINTNGNVMWWGNNILNGAIFINATYFVD